MTRQTATATQRAVKGAAPVRARRQRTERKRWREAKRAPLAPHGRPPGRSRIASAPMFVIAAANAFVGLDLTAGAARAFGNPPSVAERFLREVRAMTDFRLESTSRELPAWDAAFVHHVGYWALYGGEPARSAWPLPPAPTAQDLSEVAGHLNWLDERPVAGDLYLLWSDATRRFVRTGIVVQTRSTPGGDPLMLHCCEVIEGDTSVERAFGGGMVLRHERWFGVHDRFVRWTRDLDACDVNPAEEAACD